MARLPFIQNMDNSVKGIESPVLKITKNGRYLTQNLDAVSVDVKGVVPSGTLEITENGVYDITNKASVDVKVPSGPTPEPVVKGSIITLGGEQYKVLSTNSDLTDVEVVHVGPVTIKRYYESSPTAEQQITFNTADGDITGLKYEGSDLDVYCNETFYETLPADVKAAILDQEVTQDMYQVGFMEEGEGVYTIDNSTTGGSSYRFKKVNTNEVSVGSRHCYMLSCNSIREYFGGNSANGLEIAMNFQLQEWYRDAVSNDAVSAAFLYYSGYVGIDSGSFANAYCVRPAFHVDLTQLGY